MSAEHDRLERLEAFFQEVARLTLNHSVLTGRAVVFPRDLGEALEKVDSQWCENTVRTSVRAPGGTKDG